MCIKENMENSFSGSTGEVNTVKSALGGQRWDRDEVSAQDRYPFKGGIQSKQPIRYF